MKRIALALILIVFALLTVHGQNEPIDLILLLDTSTGMSSSYDNVNNYITRGFLSEFLRMGDTFHLVAFSDTPRLDVARRIVATGDVETIIARMMLQYPIENGSNITGAVSFAERYISGLPDRPKKIVLVTTGGQDTENIVSAASQRLSSRNATINYVKVTPGQAITNEPRSGRQDAGTQTQDRGSTDGLVSGQTGSSGTGDSAGRGTVDTLTGGSGDSGQTDQTGISHLDGSGGPSADGTGAGSSDRPSAGGSQAGTTSSGTGSGGFSFQTITSSIPLLIGFILLILLIIALIIFLLSRRLGSGPNRVISQAASASGTGTDGSAIKRVDHSQDLARYAASTSRRTTPYSDRQPVTPVVINPTGPLLLNLFVEDQNTAIGKRNIHSLKSGYSLSVGGGRGDGFLIFLVPVPAHLGELRRNGSQLTFIPKKPKYFPDLGSNEVRDCLGKTIRIISDKNYELRFRFQMYEDPLEALNRMLNSIKVPG